VASLPLSGICGIKFSKIFPTLFLTTDSESFDSLAPARFDLFGFAHLCGSRRRRSIRERARVEDEIRMSKREPTNHPPRRAGCGLMRRNFRKESLPTFRIFHVFRGQIVFFLVQRETCSHHSVGGPNKKPEHSTAHRAVATAPISCTREPLATRAGASLPLLPHSAALLRA